MDGVPIGVDEPIANNLDVWPPSRKQQQTEPTPLVPSDKNYSSCEHHVQEVRATLAEDAAEGFVYNFFSELCGPVGRLRVRKYLSGLSGLVGRGFVGNCPCGLHACQVPYGSAISASQMGRVVPLGGGQVADRSLQSKTTVPADTVRR